MTDAQSLVERLRAGASRSLDVGSHLNKYQALCDEAADLIERLNAAGERVAAEGRQAQGAYELICDERDWWWARAKRAEAALRDIDQHHARIADIARAALTAVKATTKP
jgi:hypothetical protein